MQHVFETFFQDLRATTLTRTRIDVARDAIARDPITRDASRIARRTRANITRSARSLCAARGSWIAEKRSLRANAALLRALLSLIALERERLNKTAMCRGSRGLLPRRARRAGRGHATLAAALVPCEGKDAGDDGQLNWLRDRPGTCDAPRDAAALHPGTRGRERHLPRSRSNSRRSAESLARRGP